MASESSVQDDFQTLRELVEWENRSAYTDALRRIEEQLEAAQQKLDAHHNEDLDGATFYRCLICEHIDALPRSSRPGASETPFEKPKMQQIGVSIPAKRRDS